ncbi:lipase 1-like [Leptidea sinapis]|uniref:lipase 1-like n=1 Tax=Leptidea sinapis TaxID=189913 RepID=UPI0021C40E92|nr:lipase 1-like [Leptidea sinapis]
MISYIILIVCVQSSVLTISVIYPHPHKLLSISIPENRALKRSLGFIEDTYYNFTELANKYGHETEEYEVTTDDGYLLTIFRIKTKCVTPRPYPIVLLHGIMDSADAWILAGPELGLGYILANNCYDVWAANHRGNQYSRKHIKLNPNTDFEFWNYSIDEHGYYDLPAIIDHVLNASNKEKVYFIGHSQGTTDFFIMTSIRPEYNNKIHLSIQLAPVAYLKHLKIPLANFAAKQTELIKNILDDIGLQELLGKYEIIHPVLEQLCQVAPVPLCEFILQLTTGYKDGISPRTLSVAFGHLVVGVSAKTLSHFGQLIQSKKFQRYDEGREINLQKYGSENPPEYNVSKITSAVLLMCSKNDLLSSLENVNELSSRLPNLVEEYVVQDKSWSHHNFLWGIKAPEYVFNKILGYLKKYDQI